MRARAAGVTWTILVGAAMVGASAAGAAACGTLASADGDEDGGSEGAASEGGASTGAGDGGDPGDSGPNDAGADGGARSPTLPCGAGDSATCALPSQVCCQHQDRSEACTSAGACNGSGEVPLGCYDRDNCAADQVCCLLVDDAGAVASACEPPSSCNAGIGGGTLLTCKHDDACDCTTFAMAVGNGRDNLQRTIFVCAP
jgi:hypothetical protein